MWPASLRSRRMAKCSGNASALVTAETDRPCARASDLTRLVSRWRAVGRGWSASCGDAAIVIDVMWKVSLAGWLGTTTPADRPRLEHGLPVDRLIVVRGKRR